jgi:hypothetical protein
MMMHAARRYLRPDPSKAPPTSMLLLRVSLIPKHGPRVGGGVYFMHARPGTPFMESSFLPGVSTGCH